jgi:MSHA biogenesis protein MshG
VPLSQGIELVAGTLGNLHYENKILEFKARIDEGIPFSQAAREIGIFTPMVIQIFRVGEQTGKIDELLEHVSTVYDREVNHTMDNINTLIEPLMLALIGSLVLMLALGVMLPYLEMIKSAAIR